jgi:hypothetical protein
MRGKCGSGGKHSKAIKGKYAQGGTVTPVPTAAPAPTAAPTTTATRNGFAQGRQKYLDLIQRRRADARNAMKPNPSPTPVLSGGSTRKNNNIWANNTPFAPSEGPTRGGDRMWSDGMTPSQISKAQQNKTFGSQTPTGNSGSSARYTGLRDMVDGGGPGKSGATFSGGPFSGTANKIGVKPVGSGGNMTTSPRPQPKSSPALSKSPSSSSKSTSTTSKSSSSSASSGGSKSGGSSGGSKSGGSSGGSKSGGSSGGRR